MTPSGFAPTPKQDDSPPKTPFETVAELSKLYGGADKVPDELLTKNGYSRREDGTLAPISLEVKKMRTLEQKNSEKPFEPFTITLTAEKSARRIDRAERGRIKQLQERIDSFNGIYSDTYLEYIASPEVLERSNQLKKDLINAGSTSDFEKALRGSVIYSLTDQYPENSNQIKLVGNAYPLKGVRLLDMVEPYGDDVDDFMSSDAVERLSELAEHERGIVTDIDEIYKNYDEVLQLNTPLELFDTNEAEAVFDEQSSDGGYLMQNEWWAAHSEEDYNQEMNKLLAELKSQGIETRGQYMMYTVGKHLDELFPKTQEESYADETIKIAGAVEMAKYLYDVEQKQIEAAKPRLKEAKAVLKSIPFGQEGRTEAENELTQAKEALREVNSKLLPLREAFERPRYVAHKANQAYDALSELLMGGNNGVVEMTFISDIDQVLDADPGKVSGDCTEGLPLPFLNPKNGLYNVKVYIDGGHVGNIYLLQINGKKSDKPIIWHLDAIQIPQYLNWKTAAATIVESLKDQASKAGVEYITINGSLAHISNYNYIQEAFNEISEIIPDGKITNTIRNHAERTSDASNGERMQAENEQEYKRLA